MRRIAIGDVQGCLGELRALLRRCRYSADRDQLWFVGDLVNRGPESLGVLRFVRDLGEGARVVLGNHDLHLLAVALGPPAGANARSLRAGDTLDDILSAPDRDELLEWLLTRPLAVQARDEQGRVDLMVHAGVVPAWTREEVLTLAVEVADALQRDPRGVLGAMYGNRPDRWSSTLMGEERRRFVINTLTRLRFCTPDGRIDLRSKGAPGTQPEGELPWFETPERRTHDCRVIFGHWSTLGLLRRENLLGLDTGCVWGGALTAISLDDPEQFWQEPSPGHRRAD